MRSRRAGHGCSIGYATSVRMGSSSARTARVASPTVKLSDVPHLAAALAVIALDVAAYEQTEEYWQMVWKVEP